MLAIYNEIDIFNQVYLLENKFISKKENSNTVFEGFN